MSVFLVACYSNKNTKYNSLRKIIYKGKLECRRRNKDSMKKITTTKIAIFKGKTVRKTIYKNEWWFSVIDIIEALTGTERSRKYWNDLKKKPKK